MKVAILGGGPAGLYFSLLMKKANPAHEVVLLERNAPDATFGWGVVFSDQTLGNFKAADPESFQEISDNFARWDDIDIHYKGRTITSGGHGFAGIARMKLLEILQNRAAELGADLRFGCEVRDDSDLPGLGPRRRRSRDRGRRRQQRGTAGARGGVPARSRVGAGQVRLARHHAAVRRLHLRLRRDRARHLPGPRLPLQRHALGVHRRVRRGVLAQRRLRPPGYRRHDRRLRR